MYEKLLHVTDGNYSGTERAGRTVDGQESSLRRANREQIQVNRRQETAAPQRADAPGEAHCHAEPQPRLLGALTGTWIRNGTRNLLIIFLKREL